MEDEGQPATLIDWARGHVCPQTIGGWLWYCEEHDSHGNADSEDEAQALANAHAAHHADREVGETCQIVVWTRSRI